MWHFPHSELSVLARCKEYVFILVVVNHFHLLSKGTLKLNDALAFLLDVSDFEESIPRSLTVTRHPCEPLELRNIVFYVVATV